MMTMLLVLTGAFAVSVIGTHLIRRYALARNLMDVPNARSSHVVATPRGGGVAIVVAFLGGILALWAGDAVDARLVVALVGSGLLVAAVGFLDDARGLPAGPRLLVHVLAATWAVAWLGGLPPLLLFGRQVDLGSAGHALAVVGLIWMLNLYNFMDGIDGVAAIEAVTTCAGGLAIALLQHRSDAAWVVPALLGSASLGFLLWNFPPARIFMGDAGSGFLGLMLGVMAIDAARITPQSLWSWLILLAVFTTDATMTLIRRVQRGKKPHEAHRTHAYQHAAHDHRGHRQVSLAVAAINVGWLLPLALAVQLGRVDGLTGLIVASVPLVWLALRYGAGTDRAS